MVTTVAQRAFAIRVLAVATGLCAGIAGGFLATDGDILGFATVMVLTAATVVISARVVPPETRRNVLPLVLFATLLRVAGAVVLYDGLVAVGRNGFLTGDDATYADLSSRLAQILHGQPASFNYGAESYLLGTFVYLESAIFYVFGPKVILVELLNAAMGGLLVAFVYDIALRLFAQTRAGLVAAALVATYPSLVLWSALNLKDSLALLLIAMVMWLLVVYQARRSWLVMLVVFAPLLLIESLRSYIFIGLALVIPASVLVTAGGAWRDRAIRGVVAVGISGALLGAHFTGIAPPLPSGLLGLEAQRSAMGVGAKTSFADTPVVVLEPGVTYVVGTTSPSSSPSPNSSPTPSPQVVIVSPGTQLIVTTMLSTQTPQPGGASVVVRPGDIVIVGQAGATPALPEDRKSLSVEPSASTVELALASETDAVARTLRHLPKGVAYVLFAPFPWVATRALDVLPMPEMLLWYLALAGAILTAVRYRTSWRSLTPFVLFISGILLILALAEGNVGTLYRHRAMVIPFVLILASPAFAQVLSHLDRRRRPRVGVTERSADPA